MFCLCLTLLNCFGFLREKSATLEVCGVAFCVCMCVCILVPLPAGLAIGADTLQTVYRFRGIKRSLQQLKSRGILARNYLQCCDISMLCEKWGREKKITAPIQMPVLEYIITSYPNNVSVLGYIPAGYHWRVIHSAASGVMSLMEACAWESKCQEVCAE